jgi:branched-chain amino acid transport system permease protein
MDFLGQVLINGFFISGLYALIALGVTLIFGILRIGDLAQGALYAVASYLILLGTQSLGLSYFFVAPLAMLIVALLSALNSRFIYRPLRRMGLGPTFMGAIGLLVIIQNLLALGFTWEPQALPSPWGPALVRIGAAVLPPQKLAVVLLAALGSIGLWLFLRHTYPGKALRALAQNWEAARLMGINAEATSALAFGIAGTFSGAAGVLMATVWPITPYGGALLVLKAFAIAIIAGGRVRGALLGALVVGISESLVQGYWAAQLSDLVPFVLLALTLLLRPQSLGPDEGDQEKTPHQTGSPPRFYRLPWARYLSLGVVLIAALLSPLLANTLWLHLLILMGIAILLVSGLDLLTGYAGIPSLAQAGLWGIGAYTSALLAMRLGWIFPATLLAAMLLTMMAALIVGVLGLRLKGRWTSFTFIIGVVITLLLGSSAGLTEGTRGLIGVPPLKVALPNGGMLALNPIRDKLSYLYLVMTFVLLALWLKSRIIHSRMGQALRAIREDEVLARTVGVPTERYKLLVFLVSAGFAGVAGSLYAHYLLYLNPDLFTFTQSFNLFVMNLVGGTGTLLGPILGPTALTLFSEFTRPINGAIGEITFGLLLIVALIYLPDGLAGGFWRALKRLAQFRAGRAESVSNVEKVVE